jgi:hypothetical protein
MSLHNSYTKLLTIYPEVSVCLLPPCYNLICGMSHCFSFIFSGVCLRSFSVRISLYMHKDLQTSTDLTGQRLNTAIYPLEALSL